MIVRVAQPDDAQALSACLAAAYAPFVHLGLPPVSEGVAEDIATFNVWVAELDEVVVGGIVVQLDEAAHVVNLAVHPDASGHGIGQALISTAKQAAIEAGFSKLQLATHLAMTGTQAFYVKNGWLETGREGNKVYFAIDLT